MTESNLRDGQGNHVSATARFVLAAVCCTLFIVSVVGLARVTGDSPLRPLRDVAFTFWGVVLNFTLCLATVAYVSRRLQKPRKNDGSSR